MEGVSTVLCEENSANPWIEGLTLEEGLLFNKWANYFFKGFVWGLVKGQMIEKPLFSLSLGVSEERFLVCKHRARCFIQHVFEKQIAFLDVQL